MNNNEVCLNLNGINIPALKLEFHENIVEEASQAVQSLHEAPWHNILENSL